MAKIPEGVDHGALNVVARRVLLDGLDALRDHAPAVTVVGAQAVYLRTAGEVELAVASFTSDADLSIDVSLLGDEPLLEQAMAEARFVRGNQPGMWQRSEQIGDTVADIAVDLRVAEQEAGKGNRSVEMPPHDRLAARRVNGLEAAVVDADDMDVVSLDPGADPRTVRARVAGPAALMIAKAYKLHERSQEPGQARLANKDAGDVARLMLATDPDDVAARFEVLLGHERTSSTAATGLGYLHDLFGEQRTLGTVMATEALAGDPIEEQIPTIAPAYLRALPRP